MAPLVSYIELSKQEHLPPENRWMVWLREVGHVLVAGTMAAGVFALDMATTSRLSVGVMYVPLLFCGRWFDDRRAVLGLAALASLLAVMGFLLSTPYGEWESVLLVNRMLAVCSLFIVAFILYGERCIEEERRTEQILYKRAIDSFDAGIWEWPDVNKPQVYWSDVYYRMLGYERGEIPADVDWVFENQFHPDNMAAVREAITAQMDRGQRFRLQARLLTKDRGYRWFSWSGDLLEKKGGVRGIVGSMIDIHDRKMAEEDLKKAADRLAEQNVELTRSNQELENFAYITSHDLQEPLRMVRSYCELLKEKFGDKLGTDGREFIDFAVDGALRMQLLIRDLLSYSRVARNEMKMEPVDMKLVVDEVKKVLGQSLKDVDALVEVRGELPVVMGERNMLGQVMQNLLSNAIKFRKPEEPLKVKISAAREGQAWRLAVADNGIGMDVKFRDKVFEMFKRLHGREAYEGTGIGLAVCKKVIERHGGEITVDSSPGAGAVFSFTLPDKVMKGEVQQ